MPTPTDRSTMKTPTTDAQIKHMVQRFLSWSLPENFNPDDGINFKRSMNTHANPPRLWPMPSGTNLFDARQAEAMIRHLVDELP